MTVGLAGLATLVDPMDVDDFLARYWGKQRLFIPRNGANRYSHLLTATDIDDLVSFGPWSFVVSDRAGPAGNETVVGNLPSGSEGCHLGLHDLRALYQQGKTIVLNSLHVRLPSVAALGRALEQALECPINVNMYLTPPGTSGLRPHFDDHDVFICQLDGTKIWRFYDSGHELPRDREPGIVDDNLVAEPLGECRLRPGDLLYLPRGVGHGAFTEDERSLHLTIGAYVFRWADLLERAVARLSQSEVALREALPAGWIGDPKTRPSMRGQFRQLLQMLAERASFEDALGDLSLGFVDTLGELPDGRVTESTDLAGLDVETLVEKRPGVICVVTGEGDSATIYFPGGNLRDPAMTADALHFVASVDRPFRASDLPGAMSAESNRVLVRRLAKEGLLRRIDVRAPSASESSRSAG